ncbi:large ribosomal subunit protein bL36m [Erinaceus europaeus]|uniref:Ribosomal protein n=1 Tax=Erinaceus europaeus TaxID=9365 RepID=A0ABM3XE56_ERIEU|nr:large ribosomal subunit protein bL36m [Erinaceus europaeus]
MALLLRRLLVPAASVLLRAASTPGPGPLPRLLSALLGPRRPAAPPPPVAPPPPARGFKTRAALRRRCRACRLVKRRGRWFVVCEQHPRHKQRQL